MPAAHCHMPSRARPAVGRRSSCGHPPDTMRTPCKHRATHKVAPIRGYSRRFSLFKRQVLAGFCVKKSGVFGEKKRHFLSPRRPLKCPSRLAFRHRQRDNFCFQFDQKRNFARRKAPARSRDVSPQRFPSPWGLPSPLHVFLLPDLIDLIDSFFVPWFGSVGSLF